ncbi:MAG: septum formation protein Maf [Clostridia bacterium]|nr:septum formation protein Maf [Clostridia bacterium]
MRVILASRSPRRRELLSELFSKFDIIVRDCDESLGRMSARDGVRELARKKGRATYDYLLSDSSAIAGENPDLSLIISSDTLVECDGLPLGKPRGREDAEWMLNMLSGRGHRVHTGVAVHYGGRCVSGVATTEVFFKELSREEIDEYIKTGEPFDKAGSYGIQGEAGKFVTHINGDMDTVIGLSLSLVSELCDKILEGDTGE